MIDKWKLSPDLYLKAVEFLHQCEVKGYSLKITSGNRTQAEQNKLYAQGRTTPGKIVTWTKNSRHIGGNAIDIAFIGRTPYPTNFDWSKIGIIGESLGLKWGGRFKQKDNVHFEL